MEPYKIPLICKLIKHIFLNELEQLYPLWLVSDAPRSHHYYMEISVPKMAYCPTTC